MSSGKDETADTRADVGADVALCGNQYSNTDLARVFCGCGRPATLGEAKGTRKNVDPSQRSALQYTQTQQYCNNCPFKLTTQRARGPP